MTSVDFYTHVDDKLLFACQITARAMAKKQPVLIYADAREAAAVDALLWTTPARSFIPHCAPTHKLAAETPVIIDDMLEHEGPAAVLVNLHSEPPPFFSRFERLAEIVGRGDDAAAAGRTRFRFYRERGYEMRAHNLSERT